MAQEQQTTATVRRGKPQQFRGVVVSAKSKDTIVVLVTTYRPHPKYKKYIRQSKKFHAHDPGNTAPEGAEVLIEASRPFSRLKRFRLVKIISLPEAEQGAPQSEEEAQSVEA